MTRLHNLLASACKGVAAAALLLLIFVPCPVKASNAQEARAMFDKAWGLITSPQGFSVTYNVNIIGIYKTHGTIWAKGKKQHYIEPRYCAWSDGSHYYKVDTKKKTVELHNQNSPKRDKYLSKFTFSPADYAYSWSRAKEGIIINLDAKRDVKGVKHAKVVLDPKTRYPTALRVKVLFFWTKVVLTNFRAGGISDDLFKYPAAKFKSYKFTNCWPD